jgi:hypothetical protein
MERFETNLKQYEKERRSKKHVKYFQEVYGG